jgi:hypothetical protein
VVSRDSKAESLDTTDSMDIGESDWIVLDMETESEALA